MIKNDRQLGKPLGLFQNTKDNIEALTGLTGGEIAYATDTGEDGVYDAVTAGWVWGRGGGSLPSTTAENDFIVGSVPTGTWAKKTLAETLEILQLTPRDGWILRSETWTRTGDHTFTVASGTLTDTQLLTAYRKETKVKYNDGAIDYGVIGNAVSAGANSITVTLITNTDFAMAATTITDKYISYISNPAEFPVTFNWSPSWTNLTVGDGTITSKYSCAEGRITGELLLIFGTTTSISGAVAFTVPANISASTIQILGIAILNDAGIAQHSGIVHYNTINSLLVGYFSVSGSAIVQLTVSSSAPFTWGSGDRLSIQFSYFLG